MGMIPVGIARIVLHVSDQRVVPIDQVKGTVWRKLEVDGSEIPVIGLQEVLSELRGIPRSILCQPMLLDPKESDVVPDKDITLHLVGEVSAAHDLET
jgi:hypothetical protein